MSKSDLRHELKKPDAVAGTMRQIVDALIEHQKKVLLGALALFLVWIGMWWMGERRTEQEDQDLGQFFLIKKAHETQLAEAQKKYDEASKDKKKSDQELDQLLESQKSEADAKYRQSLETFLKEKAGTTAAGQAGLTLADLLFEEKKWEEGLAILDQVKAVFRKGSLDSVTLGMNRARALENLNRWEESLNLYKELERSGSPFSASLFQMGQARCLTQLGKADEARKIYEAIEKVEDDPFRDKARGFLRLMMRKEKNS